MIGSSVARRIFGLGLGLGLTLTLGLGTLFETPAEANGRYPAAQDLHFRQGSIQDFYVAITWGLLVTHDEGLTFRWVCENAVGYGGEYDPDYAVSASGAVFATASLRGLVVTRDDCLWNDAPIPSLSMSSVTIGGDGAIYAASYGPDDSRIYKSVDDGVTFSPITVTGTPVDWWGTLEVAPSDPQRLYLTGFRVVSSVKEKVFFRSDNGGQSWNPLPLTDFDLTMRSDLEVLAISPDDPDLLFARVTYSLGNVVSDEIYRSIDGGASWTSVKAFEGEVRAVVIRRYSGTGVARDDAEVIIGTPLLGTHRSSDGGRTFTSITPALKVGCMLERSDGVLFACADNLAPDYKAVARGTDGTSWDKVLEFKDVAGPVRCTPGTQQKDVCELQLWCGTKAQLGLTSTEIPCGADNAGNDNAVAPPPKSCCSSSPAQGALFSVVVAAGLLRPRRRRAR